MDQGSSRADMARVYVRWAIHVVREELSGLAPRRSIGLMLAQAVPALSGNRVRTAVLRCAGLRLGRGTMVGGPVTVVGGPSRRLDIGENCWINGRCQFDISDDVVIGDGAALGQQVLIVTDTHRIGPSDRRAKARRSLPVEIGAGAWLGARVVVLPGVTIGRGAIVAAGAVVAADVEPNTLVGGTPARLIRSLPDDGESGWH